MKIFFFKLICNSLLKEYKMYFVEVRRFICLRLKKCKLCNFSLMYDYHITAVCIAHWNSSSFALKLYIYSHHISHFMQHRIFLLFLFFYTFRRKWFAHCMVHGGLIVQKIQSVVQISFSFNIYITLWSIASCSILLRIMHLTCR